MFRDLFDPHVTRYHKFLYEIFVLSTNNRQKLGIEGKTKWSLEVRKMNTADVLLPKREAPVAQFKGCGFESHRGWGFSLLRNITNPFFRLIFISLAMCRCVSRAIYFKCEIPKNDTDSFRTWTLQILFDLLHH